MSDIEWVDKEWLEDLTWCPSQCYRRVRAGGKTYTLYLRWRWDDPWQFHVIEGDAVNTYCNGCPWTTDLFRELGFWYTDEELKEAEERAESLFVSLWTKGHLGAYWEDEAG